jgi:hypothetical protein
MRESDCGWLYLTKVQYKRIQRCHHETPVQLTNADKNVSEKQRLLRDLKDLLALD